VDRHLFEVESGQTLSCFSVILRKTALKLDKSDCLLLLVQFLRPKKKG